MNAATWLLLLSSALFAWSMGGHYAGSVAGTAYGAGVLTLRRALVLTAIFTVIGAVTGSIGVLGTYSHLLSGASRLDIAAAQLASAVVTCAATYLRLPTSTIQIYAFSVLGVALVAGLQVGAGAFGLLIVGWIAGPTVAFGLGYVLAHAAGRAAAASALGLRWLLIVVVLYSGFVLGSNDVSNAASSLVGAHLLAPRLAALYGGGLMALGVLTAGRRTLERVGRDIVALDVPLAATAQLSKALTLTVVNSFGYNASINQTIVGGLVGAGAATDRSKLNRGVIRNIVLNWTLSPLIALPCAAVTSLALRALLGH